jgi:peptidoglycan LD-endopeptidase LytH
LTAVSLVASAAALRGRPAMLEGEAAALLRPEGPPLPGLEAEWRGEDGVDASLATVPWILRRTTYIDSLMAPERALEPVEAAWLGAAQRALRSAVTLQTPHREIARFDSAPDAAGYNIPLHAGEQIRIELGTEPADVPLFVDLLGANGRTVLAARTGAGALEYTAGRDETVLLRIQPPVGEAADYTLSVVTRPALLFPVAGRDAGSILGHFHEPRDGGARRHQGVDVAAPLGTPVLAAAAGVVERVDDTPLGGLVVWLRERGTNRLHYYAHLDTQLVRRGARLKQGDVLGTVGTTGNAEGTTPHLHFEVKVRGKSVDPMQFLGPLTLEDADSAWLNRPAPATLRTQARTRLTGAALRSAASPTARATPMPRHTGVEILGASGRYYRVRTAEGLEGFLAGWLLEPLPPQE